MDPQKRHEHLWDIDPVPETMANKFICTVSSGSCYIRASTKQLWLFLSEKIKAAQKKHCENCRKLLSEGIIYNCRYILNQNETRIDSEGCKADNPKER